MHGTGELMIKTGFILRFILLALRQITSNYLLFSKKDYDTENLSTRKIDLGPHMEQVR